MSTLTYPPPLLPNPPIHMLKSCKTMIEVRQIHAQLIKTDLISHKSTAGKLVAFCSLSKVPGSLDYALSILRSIKNPDPYTFFVLIKGFSERGAPLESVALYAQMLCTLIVFDGIETSLPSVLKSCGKLRAVQEGKQIHGQVLKTHFKLDPFVSNSLLRMYSELGEIELARRVFDHMPNRDVISWNSMLSGYLKAGLVDFAHDLFGQMPERDLVSCNCMIDQCGKFGRLDLAEEVFNAMEKRDVVTWTSMITAYVNNGHPKKALDLFKKMLVVCHVKPDGPAIVSVLSAIADLGFVEEGKWVHSFMSANMIDLEFGFVGSALIDMYSKCGYIHNAYTIFKSVSHRRNIGDWNSMISGLALHGLGREAIMIFLEMEHMGIEPDDITFVGLLKSCSHGGLVKEGKHYFSLMKEKFKIVPKIQHYGCMIDLYARAGCLDNALEVIESMPMQPDVLVWKAILMSSLKHGNSVIGKHAAINAIKLAPDDSSSYVLLSNIHAKEGRWDDVGRVRLTMRQQRVKKVPGCSSVMVKGKMHQFLAGRQNGSGYSEAVLNKLEGIVNSLKMAGYEPDTSQVLLDVEEDDKESMIRLHSEKMAIAFALINRTKESSPIHVVKNLRICSDCHCFMKMVSRVYNCQVIVRDPNRFHHFKDGSCSCKDFW